MRPGALLLLAALLPLPACGGSGEKQALRAYEAAVETAMTEDETVSERLKSLRDDVVSGSATLAEQATYGREQALPFYRRFREAASKAPTKDPRLAKIHARLVAYLDHRVSYVEATEAQRVAGENEAVRRFQEAQAPMQGISQEVMAWIEKTGGRLPDREAAEAMAIAAMFNERVFNPFMRGQAQAKEVSEALRTEVLPKVGRVAERTKDQLAAPGFPGTVARWAKVQDEVLRILAGSLPQLQALQLAEMRAGDAWTGAEDLRTKYLEELRAYRESLR